MTMWPPDIRKELKKGLHAKVNGEFDLSAQHLQQSVNICLFAFLE